MTRRLNDVFEELRNAIFAAYTAYAERDRDCEAAATAIAAGSRWLDEQERREIALERIQEILDRHPFASFSAAHLGLLELILAYWREAEVEVGAPAPDPLQ